MWQVGLTVLGESNTLCWHGLNLLDPHIALQPSCIPTHTHAVLRRRFLHSLFSLTLQDVTRRLTRSPSTFHFLSLWNPKDSASIDTKRCLGLIEASFGWSPTFLSWQFYIDSTVRWSLKLASSIFFFLVMKTKRVRCTLLTLWSTGQCRARYTMYPSQLGGSEKMFQWSQWISMGSQWDVVQVVRISDVTNPRGDIIWHNHRSSSRSTYRPMSQLNIDLPRNNHHRS